MRGRPGVPVVEVAAFGCERSGASVWLPRWAQLALLASVLASGGCDKKCPAGERRCVGNRIQSCPRWYLDTPHGDLHWTTGDDCGAWSCVVVAGCGQRCTDNGGDTYAFCAPDPQPEPRCPAATEGLVCSGADLLDCRFGYLFATTTCVSPGQCQLSISNECLGPLEQVSFSTTGSMTTARVRHAAALLTSGLVLVAGGAETDYDQALRSAELYDPASGTFQATGSMTTARANLSATLLPSGEVLMVGGGGVVSAELYHPPSGRFYATTGDLPYARALHTATLLDSEHVLVAGGYNEYAGALASAELYDPTSGTFTATGSMVEGRDRHTATLLPSGRVLVAGGHNNPNSSEDLSTAEEYDPDAGTFVATQGPMTCARAGHTATLLPSGQVLLVGACGADLYDPVTRTFAPTAGSWVVARNGHSATLTSSGKVVLVGGMNALPWAEVYDPESESFALATGSLSIGRYYHTATPLPAGDVLIAAGVNSSYQALASAELYE
jgi:hypothetical protein